MRTQPNGQTASRRQVLKTTALGAGTVLFGSPTGIGKAAARTTEQDADNHANSKGVAGGRANEIEIGAKHDDETGEHQFEFSTTEVASGWTTVTFDNQTDHTHFAYLARLPRDAIAAADAEGADLLDFYVEHVTRPFQWFMDTIDPEREPDPDDLSDKYTNLDEEVIFPDWYGNVLPSGGAGFTSGDTTSTTTVELEPGEYIVECYVKTDDGEFHSYVGMIDLLTVTDDQSDASEPEATLALSLSTAGIDAEETVQPGQHTVAVRIEEQQIYEHLLGHDVHLIRFDGPADVADVNDWMNWMNPDGLVSDGTEPSTFLGGVQTIVTPELLKGGDAETAYVHVVLNPGAYAWVSEVPDSAEKGLLKPFVVPFE